MAQLSETVRKAIRNALLKRSTLRYGQLSSEEASEAAQPVFDRFQGQISARDFLLLLDQEAQKLR